jgi:hypothetical protein
MCGIAGFLDQRNHFKQDESLSVLKKWEAPLRFEGQIVVAHG